MTDESKFALAKKVYGTLCDAIDARHWRYEKDDEKLVVHFGVSGDDIPMNMLLIVDIQRQLVRLMSPMPFKFSEEKRIDGALATCAATYTLADGSFDYDVQSGVIMFRMTASFHESEIGEGLFQYMIDCSCAIVDMYNDKFFAIDKGLLSVSDFIASL